MLSGRSLIKGVAVGFLGIIVSLVGLDPHTGSERFVFGQLWLWDGVSVVAAVLGLFAIPEMLALGVKGGAIAEVKGKMARYDLGQVIQGIFDVFRHPWLSLRTSVFGAAIGAIPGLGGDAASWLCYGHAVQTCKNPENFGKGDSPGVRFSETVIWGIAAPSREEP